MEIIIGSDHAGFDLKSFIIDKFEDINFTDVGPYYSDSVDYADFAHQVAKEVNDNNKVGILICGSGEGVSMTANKYQKVRAALVWNEEISKLSRQHNDANILCLPARFISRDEAISIIKAFLNTEFEGGRHLKRINKIPC